MNDGFISPDIMQQHVAPTFFLKPGPGCQHSSAETIKGPIFTFSSPLYANICPPHHSHPHSSSAVPFLSLCCSTALWVCRLARNLILLLIRHDISMSLSTTGREGIYSCPAHTDFRPWLQTFKQTNRILSNMTAISDRPLKTESWSSVSYVCLKTKAWKVNLNAAWGSFSAAPDEVIRGKVNLIRLYSVTNSKRHVFRKRSAEAICSMSSL